MIFLEADTDQDYRIKNHALDNLTWPMVTTGGGAPKQMDDISSVLFTIFVPEWREGEFLIDQTPDSPIGDLLFDRVAIMLAFFQVD